MNPNTKAWLHLGLIGICLLVADQLPTWYKLWFVSETGHFHTSSTITIILLVGMFLRWRSALGLMIVWQVVHLFGLFFIYFASSNNFSSGEHTFGYSLLAFLRLMALAIIFFSADINRYVRRRSTDLAS